MSSETVHVAGDHAAELLAELRRRGFDAQLFDPARCSEVASLLTHGVSDDIAGALGALRLLQLRGVGADHVPLDALPLEVEIASLRGVFASLVAEYTWSAVLTLWRNWPVLWERFHARDARRFPCESLEGRTIVVLGAGEIGRRVLRTARSFGMASVAVTRTQQRAVEHADEVVALQGPSGGPTFEAALARADVLVVAAPLTAATRGLLSRPLLERLPRTARVVVVSRGGIVDEAALIALLQEGRLGGAILDVCEVEPVPPSSALYATPGLYVTPHLAGFSRAEPMASLERFVENLGRARRGEELLGAVDRARGY